MCGNTLQDTTARGQASADPAQETGLPAATGSTDALSKRGARRVVQRALVLVGRDRATRQTLRAVELNSLWVIENWDLDWTVLVRRGRPEFHRGRVGRSQVVLRWRTAKDFFDHVECGVAAEGAYTLEGETTRRRVVGTVFSAFAKALRAVLADPFGDDGERLL